jgi:alpha-maltose-1-phosphate synthase
MTRPMPTPISVLLPINIDRWRSSIATQMRAVVEANPDIHFYSFSSPTTDEDRINGETFWARANVTKLDRFSFFQHRYDVVQLAAISNLNIAAALLAKWRSGGRARIVSIICLEIVPEDRNSWRNYHKLLPWPDYFLSVSHAAGQLSRTKAPDRYAGVILNGYAEDYFDPFIEDEEGMPEEMRTVRGKPYLLYVSSLDKRKRTDHLIRMALRMPGVTFVAAGFVTPGEGEPYLKALKEVPNVLWLGLVQRRQLRWLYKHAAAMFFPSDREGLPLAVIEAHGMGLPVIAQPKSSMPDLIKPGINGELILCEDEEGWEQACRKYLALQGEERMQWIHRLHGETASQLSWSAAGKRYGDFYKKIVGADPD